jgi:hypothetical protein
MRPVGAVGKANVLQELEERLQFLTVGAVKEAFVLRELERYVRLWTTAEATAAWTGMSSLRRRLRATLAPS